MAFNYNSISTSHAYMATIAGLILVIQPSVLFSFLDMEVSPSVVLVGRLFGAFLVGLSAAIYSTKDLSGADIPIVLVVGNAAVDFVTTMIFLGRVCRNSELDRVYPGGIIFYELYLLAHCYRAIFQSKAEPKKPA